MTIDEFNSFGWSGHMAMTYQGNQHDIVSVCFIEKLLAFQPEDNDQLTWVRCENVTSVERII